MGRQKEINKIRKALNSGSNVVLQGKYGIGRTALVRHLARVLNEKWNFIFLDFSRTPGETCRDLMGALFPGKGSAGRFRSWGYKSIRFRITTLGFADKRMPVLVLDNIGKLSLQKMSFIRHLTLAKRFRFLAIVESFVPEEKLFALRAGLIPALTLKISYLTPAEGREFFCGYAARHGLSWTDGEIEHLVETTGGYPLGMLEVAARACERSGKTCMTSGRSI